MRLIVGLGNPEPQYARTRHNAGFMVLDHLARQHGLTDAKAKFHARVIEARLADQRCCLMLPMTYMNHSGLAVAEAARFFKVEAEDILVVVDDIALPTGRIRLRGEGGAGGHNGLSDIERALGTKAYPRLRIGIDAPGREGQVDYVLGRFTAEQLADLEASLDRTCDCIESWLRDGVAATMNLFNMSAD
jgi:PTH1 family peptidyl-tRNA hydrolase